MADKRTWKSVFGYYGFNGVYQRIVDEAPPGSTIVEVGVFHGRSLISLDEMAQASGKNLKIIGVDWGLGTATAGNGPGPTANNIAVNLHECESKAIVILGESTHVASFFPDESIFCVFIDANHSYESVKRDIETWTPKVVPGGIIAGDDYDWEGSKEAVRGAVGEKFGDCPAGEGCWLARKRQS